MTIEITVPVLPESVADGLLLDWNKQVGERVSRDEILVEVETDKIVLEVPAPADGVLAEILRQPGATVQSGEVLAKLEPESATKAATKAATKVATKVATKAAATETNPPAASQEMPATGDRPPASTAGQPPAVDADQPVSPAVRRLVEEHGLNPAEITGSGRDGRVTKEDILNFIADQVTPDEPADDAAPPRPPVADAVPAPPPPPAVLMPQSEAGAPAMARTRAETREPMSRLRRTIAERLVQAQQTAALLTTFNQVNMRTVMELRARYKEEFEKTHGTRLGFMSFFVKASVAALQRFPLVNAHIDGADIVRHNYYDIGIAVSSPRGLVVPVLRDCERMNFAGIEAQIRAFGERARTGKIDLNDLTGGTFTITNGGVFGSLLSTPIVNPPQSAILGMHKIEERPVAEDGRVVIRPMMYLALTYDHRIIDGQEAVRFLVAIKELLEDPASMLLQL